MLFPVLADLLVLICGLLTKTRSLSLRPCTLLLVTRQQARMDKLNIRVYLESCFKLYLRKLW